MMQSRTHTCGQLRIENAGEKVRLVGWMENVREVGGSIAFVVLRDFYGTTQIVVEDAAILAQMTDMRERQSQLDQLDAYKAGCRKYGGLLAKLAEVIPAEVQLTALTIPEPPPQMLSDPKNPKRPPLLGPTNTIESVHFRVSGRTAATASVTSLMEAIEGDAFGEWIVADKKKNAAARKKRRINIRQETRAGEDGVRMLTFDVEFRCKGRRFEK